RLEHGLALGHVAAADEDRRVLLVLAATGEDRAVDERADIVGRDIGITGNPIGAAVIGHNGVEHTRIGIGIEQKQQFLHDAHSATRFWGLPATKASTLSMS